MWPSSPSTGTPPRYSSNPGAPISALFLPFFNLSAPATHNPPLLSWTVSPVRPSVPFRLASHVFSSKPLSLFLLLCCFFFLEMGLSLIKQTPCPTTPFSEDVSFFNSVSTSRTVRIVAASLHPFPGGPTYYDPLPSVLNYESVSGLCAL